jgi:hypothetical protein
MQIDNDGRITHWPDNMVAIIDGVGYSQEQLNHRELVLLIASKLDKMIELLQSLQPTR